MNKPIQFETYSNQTDNQDEYLELRNKYLYELKWCPSIHIHNSIFSNSWEHIKGIELGFRHNNNFDYDLILLPYPKETLLRGKK